MYENVNMFEVHFRRRYNSRNDYVRIGQAATVAEAFKLRKVSGDLVVDMRNGEVVKNRVWLWMWEVKDPTCYAQRAIADAISR